MKQRRHLSNKISVAFAASILSISLTGVTCGSFAWFLYATHAPIEEFNGVTVGFGNLQAGIISEVELTEAERFGLIKDEEFVDQHIYWFDGHESNPEAISYVLAMNGYATNTLYPVTTSKFANGDNFRLFSAPKILSDGEYIAENDNYIHLPMVFRYEDIIEEGTYISDENIYLSQVKFNSLNSNSHIYEAIRIYSNNHGEYAHLINPSSNENGTTDVGGILDLNGDGFYDTVSYNNVLYEHIYGKVKESTPRLAPSVDPIYPTTTFDANHSIGAYTYDFVPEVAQYEGFSDFKTKRKPVTVTNSQTDNLAYLDLSIYVEGWDTHVVDSEIGIPFSMELKFEVVF